jgi:hypothetical protein
MWFVALARVPIPALVGVSQTVYEVPAASISEPTSSPVEIPRPPCGPSRESQSIVLILIHA